MTRANLPTRRPNVTRAVDWDGHSFTVTVGFDPATGKTSEVFADTLKGGQMQATLSDVCIVISIALQHGVTPGELTKTMGETPVLWGEEGQTQPASPLGAVMAALLAEVR